MMNNYVVTCKMLEKNMRGLTEGVHKLWEPYVDGFVSHSLLVARKDKERVYLLVIIVRFNIF